MKRRLLQTLFVLAFLALLSQAVWAGPSATESSLDEQAYALQKSHIRTDLPQAKVLAHLAARIGPAAQKVYGAPFSFYLLAERDPDAFEYYGPRVYVSRGMVDFADSREELAGVMCHEASHVLHHDGTRTDRATSKDNAKIRVFLKKAARLTRNHLTRAIAAVAREGENLAELRYSRAQEEAADLSGATICSNAGSNPWGIVWMLRKLQREAPSGGFSWFSDHPTNKARIAALEKYLRRNAMFASWTSDESLGSTPLKH